MAGGFRGAERLGHLGVVETRARGGGVLVFLFFILGYTIVVRAVALRRSEVCQSRFGCQTLSCGGVS